MNNAIRANLFGSGLRARAIRASLMSIVSIGGSQVIRLASNLVLTRLLFPEAFGIMAIASVVVGGVQLFSDVGLRQSVVQSDRNKDPDFLDTVWTVQAIRGGILFAALVLLAYPVSVFYDEPLLAAIIPVSALGVLISGLSSVRVMTLSRELVLGRVTMIGLGSYVASSLVTILLAWWTQSIWALPIGGLTAPLLTTIATHTLLPGRADRLRLDPAAVRELFGFGKYILLSTLAAFFITQADRAILGKFVALEELAFYNIAFFLATAPIMIGNALAGYTVFPLYAQRPPKESAANARNLEKARASVTAVLIFGTAIFALLGPWLVGILYDPRYQSAGPIVTLIAMASLPSLITITHGQEILAAGRSGRFAILVISKAIVRVAVLAALVPTAGTVGAAIALFVAELLYYPIMVALVRPFGTWSPRHDALAMLASALVVAVAAWVHADLLRETVLPVLNRF